MGLIGIIPDNLFSPEHKDDIIIMLRSLDIPPRRKKQAFAEWGQLVGIGLTKEDYQRLLGYFQEGV